MLVAPTPRERLGHEKRDALRPGGVRRLKVVFRPHTGKVAKNAKGKAEWRDLTSTSTGHSVCQLHFSWQVIC